MTDLMQRLYEKAGGKTYKKNTTVTAANWAAAVAIATAPASGTLWITHIIVQQTAANKPFNIGISAEGDEFKDLQSRTVVTGPIVINMSSCPMTLTNGQILKGAHEDTATSNVTVRGYYT